MSDVTQIAQALAARLSTLPGVDPVGTIDNYLPPVETQSIALVIPPFEQTTQVWRTTAKLGPLFQSHRIRCEFWVKIDTGNIALAVTRAREIGLRAIRSLLQDRTLEGTVQSVGTYGPGASGVSISAEVASTPVQIAGVPYIVNTVLVPVTDYADAA